MDDTEFNRSILEYMLSIKGIKCAHAVNGQEAIEKVMSLSGGYMYKLILMDIDMPIMNGWEATKILI